MLNRLFPILLLLAAGCAWGATDWLAPLAAERLRQGARSDPARPLTVVQSTLDRALQSQLERQLADRVAQLPPHVSMAAMIMESDTLLVRAYAGSADFSDTRRFNHVDMVRGRNPHHIIEATFKALARAMDFATQIDPRVEGVLSTKGAL